MTIIEVLRVTPGRAKGNMNKKCREVAERRSKITPADWYIEAVPSSLTVNIRASAVNLIAQRVGRDDADFIINAANDIDYLLMLVSNALDRITTSEAEVERLTAALEKYIVTSKETELRSTATSEARK